jgi:hypothetical protein
VMVRPATMAGEVGSKGGVNDNLQVLRAVTVGIKNGSGLVYKDIRLRPYSFDHLSDGAEVIGRMREKC